MKNKKPIASPQALDELLKDIGQAWDIAMKKTLKKNDDGSEDDDSDAPEAPEAGADQQDAPEAPAAGGADQGAPAGAPPAAGQESVAPGADAGAGAPPAGQDPAAQGAPGADAGQDPSAAGQDPAAAGQDPDQQLEQEGQQGQDGELSDEELQQIYGAMDPQELERHYMVLRGILRDQYQKAEAGTEDSKDEDQSAKDMEKCGEMSKSEKTIDAKVSKLEAENAELKKSIDGLLKATKILTQPVRKAATTEIEFINKSEGGSNSTPAASVQNLSKAEIKDALNTLCKTNMTLTKSERDLANRYILTGNNESEVLKLIGAKK